MQALQYKAEGMLYEDPLFPEPMNLCIISRDDHEPFSITTYIMTSLPED